MDSAVGPLRVRACCAFILRTVRMPTRLQGTFACGNSHVFPDVQQSRHLIDVLVAPPREVDDDELVGSHGGGKTEGVRYGVSAFERLGIGRGDVGGTTTLPESSMLGADSAVIEAGYSRRISMDGLAPAQCAPRASPLQQPCRR